MNGAIENCRPRPWELLASGCRSRRWPVRRWWHLRAETRDDHCAHWLSATLQPCNTLISSTSKEVQLSAATDGGATPLVLSHRSGSFRQAARDCQWRPIAGRHAHSRIKILDTTPCRVLLPTDLQV